MIKWIKKQLCPKAKTLAGYAAAGIQQSVNSSTADTKIKIAKFAAQAAYATELANRLAKMAEDGSINDVERDDLQELMSPWFEEVLAYAFGW